MQRFLADEDFNRAITRGVLRARPEVDIVRVQDVGLRTKDDAAILEWAAAEGRALLTHDAQTIPKLAYERDRNGLPTAGIFVVSQEAAVGQIIEDVILLADYSLEGEWENRVNYLPLK